MLKGALLFPVFKTMRLLIGEDDNNIIETLVSYFNGEGHQTNIAATCQELFDLIAVADARPWDVLLLDRYLRDGDSLPTVRKIRAASDIPILMLSAVPETREIATALDSGVDDYVVKPFALAEIEARLRSLMRRSEYLRFADTVIPVGKGTYDLKRHALIVRGQHIPLTTTERQILVCLLLNKRSVVSKETLQSRLTADGDALHTHILNLRKKLDGFVTITTIPGRGFMVK